MRPELTADFPLVLPQSVVAELNAPRETCPLVEVAAGDTLVARLPVNTSLKIAYQRAGWTGVLERRGLVTHGDV